MSNNLILFVERNLQVFRTLEGSDASKLPSHDFLPHYHHHHQWCHQDQSLVPLASGPVYGHSSGVCVSVKLLAPVAKVMRLGTWFVGSVCRQRLSINFSVSRANFSTTLRSHLDVSCFFWFNLFNVDVSPWPAFEKKMHKIQERFAYRDDK